MRGFLGALFAGGVLVARAAVEENEKKDSAVHVLTDANFQEFVEKHPVSLIEFYAPWCGHCKNLEPHYEEAAARLKESGGIPLAKVDATAETETATKFEIRGYPTLKLFKNGKATEYTGGRTADTIVQWIEAATGPAVEIVEGPYEPKIPERGTVFVAKVKSKDHEHVALLEKLADERRLSSKFVAVVTDSGHGELTAHRAEEDAVSTKLGDEEALAEWLDSERFPLFGPVDGENHAAYEAREQEMVWFAGKEEDYKKNAPGMREAAKKYRDTYSFVWLDTDRFGNHAEGLGISEVPGMVVRPKEGGKFLYPSKTYDAKELIKFFEDVKDGKIEKFLKSDPIPEDNSDPVKVVVGKNFNEIVFAEGKDVMLEIYAPWCGHCKRLAPIYDELAEKLEGVDHVTIAKMDGTTNEPPSADFGFRGFPTLFWVKAGEKTPVTYNDARTLDGMLKFIKENSSKPVNVDHKEEAKDEL